MKYFFDTNIIIDLCQNNTDAKRKFTEIALQEHSEIFINRLVALEALRTIHFESKKIFREAVKILNAFEPLNITQDIYDKSIAFSRFCHSRGTKLKGKCEAIDFLHFMTAKYYQLEIVSNDKDFDKLEQEYIEFTSV